MELVPWRPFGGEVSSLRREMDNLWTRFFGETPVARAFAEEWCPTVDVKELDERCCGVSGDETHQKAMAEQKVFLDKQHEPEEIRRERK
jgi:hypothetical protein